MFHFCLANLGVLIAPRFHEMAVHSLAYEVSVLFGSFIVVRSLLDFAGSTQMSSAGASVKQTHEPNHDMRGHGMTKHMTHEPIYPMKHMHGTWT